ncbi:hypothetical protein SDC9_134577 [bioreactor metagenome]|uniref:Uncharacterized protein n=1 Tax=bioreactor metagenome TaxID=1076179 RepID=A0A645DDQ7_9ZZZZ
MNIACSTPCLVIDKKPNDQIGSPGKKNTFITKVNNIIHLSGFIPFIIYFIGILDNFTTEISANKTTAYGQNLFIMNKDTIKTKVAISFTLASNL